MHSEQSTPTSSSSTFDQNWKDVKYKYNSVIKYSRFSKMEGYVFLKRGIITSVVWVESIAIISLPSQHHFIPFLKTLTQSIPAHFQQNKINQEFQKKGPLKNRHHQGHLVLGNRAEFKSH